MAQTAFLGFACNIIYAHHLNLYLMGVGMKRHLQLLVVSVAALVIGLNPLIGPVATAYAINGEPVQQDSTAEVADSESNSNSTNDPASSPSNKNQDDSDNLAAEENDPSVVADGSGDVLTDSYQYLYIAYPQLPVGVDQVIAFATPNDSDALTDATLNWNPQLGTPFLLVRRPSVAMLLHFSSVRIMPSADMI